VNSKIVDQIYIDDQMASFRAYDNKEIDWLTEMDNDLAADLLATGRKDLHVFPNFGTYYYCFNCAEKLKDGTRNPLADRRVRRALCMAIDKDPIVRNVTRTGEPTTNVVVPLGSFSDYPSPSGLAHSIAEARKLLAEAGYPNGNNFPRLRISFNNDFSQHGQIAQVLRRQWQENLGLDLELEGIEIKVYADRVQNHEFSIGRASWYGDYYDPTTFLDVFKSNSENNYSDWRVPAYDAILRKAELELDHEKRFKLLSEGENMLLEEAAILPLYQYVGHYLFRPNVHGIPLDSRLLIMLQAVKVERR
jgi:oligopeptide transport system substrate-binding protein